MSRHLTDIEVQLILKLVGSSFDEIETVHRQLANATAEELENGAILEINSPADIPLIGKKTVLGEGSLRDTDGTPIVFTLLQRDGYVWRLDISRADSGRIRRKIDPIEVVALGYGKPLSLEHNDSDA